MALPPDIDNHVSERSRKFYDRTYKWDADGFTDDAGGKCASKNETGTRD
jgi:hypothetical protein